MEKNSSRIKFVFLFSITIVVIFWCGAYFSGILNGMLGLGEGPKFGSRNGFSLGVINSYLFMILIFFKSKGVKFSRAITLSSLILGIPFVIAAINILTA